MAAGAGTGVECAAEIRRKYGRCCFSKQRQSAEMDPVHNLTVLGDPNEIPVLNGVPNPVFPNTNMYRVTAGEFLEQLHPQLPPTRLYTHAGKKLSFF